METDFVAWLRQRLSARSQLPLGPGDDAAIVTIAQQANCVVTADLLCEGVHFRVAEAGPRRIGRKSLAVNLSDLAAMAAKPSAAVVSLLLPRDGGKELAVELYEGMIELAETYQVAIAGGDTNCWDGPLVICATAIGEVTPRGPLTRSAARPDDVVVVSGSFGGSIAGKHYDFEPRVNEALLLNERYEVHAAIDVSDGLTLDLHRLCQESRVGAELQVDAIPIAQAARDLARPTGDGKNALDHALSDGEDFELVLAVPPHEARRMLDDQPVNVPLTVVGRFVERLGLWRLDKGEDQSVRIDPRGFVHGT